MQVPMPAQTVSNGSISFKNSQMLAHRQSKREALKVRNRQAWMHESGLEKHVLMSASRRCFSLRKFASAFIPNMHASKIRHRPSDVLAYIMQCMQCARHVQGMSQVEVRFRHSACIVISTLLLEINADRMWENCSQMIWSLRQAGLDTKISGHRYNVARPLCQLCSR